jgi:hypothetical protein
MADTGEALQLAAVDMALSLSDCAALAHLMRAASTASVREAGCKALAAFALAHIDGGDDAAVASHAICDAVGALVSALRAQPASTRVLLAGLDALAWWCTSMKASNFAGGAGAVDAVTAAMRVDTMDALLQQHGCNALGALFAHTPNLRLADAQAIGVVLTAMRAHPSCSAVQLGACCTILHVTAACDTSRRDAAVAQGAVELVVAVLVGADAHLCAHACKALADLTVFSTEGANRAKRCGAVEAVLRAMRMHSAHADMQNCSCQALANICDEAGACAAATRLGAHTAIIRAMQTFPAYGALQASACCALMIMLPLEPTAQDDAKHASALACVIHALQGHVADAGVQQYACVALGKLIKYQPANNVEAHRMGALLALVTILETHRSCLAVVHPCSYALTCLTWGYYHRCDTPGIADADAAMRAVVAALRAHPAALELQREGCSKNYNEQ